MASRLWCLRLRRDCGRWARCIGLGRCARLRWWVHSSRSSVSVASGVQVKYLLKTEGSRSGSGEDAAEGDQRLMRFGPRSRGGAWACPRRWPGPVSGGKSDGAVHGRGQGRQSGCWLAGEMRLFQGPAGAGATGWRRLMGRGARGLARGRGGGLDGRAGRAVGPGEAVAWGVPSTPAHPASSGWVARPCGQGQGTAFCGAAPC